MRAALAEPLETLAGTDGWAPRATKVCPASKALSDLKATEELRARTGVTARRARGVCQELLAPLAQLE